MRRRLPLLAAALTALLALPAGASAAILDVRIDAAAGPALCVSTNAPATSVTVTVGRPGGGSLATVASAAPLATQCDGSAGRSFRPALPFGSLAGAAGATLAIADSTGAAVTVPFPVASFQTAHGGFTGVVHLRDLPQGRLDPDLQRKLDSADAGPVRLVRQRRDRDARELRDRDRHDRRDAVPRRRGPAGVRRRGQRRRRRHRRHGARRRPGRRASRDRRGGAGRRIARAHNCRRSRRLGARRHGRPAVRGTGGRRLHGNPGRLVDEFPARHRRLHGRRLQRLDPLLGRRLRGRSLVRDRRVRLDARAARPGGVGGRHRPARPMRRARSRRLGGERLWRVRRGNAADERDGEGRASRGRRHGHGHADGALARHFQPAHRGGRRARLARRRQPARARPAAPAGRRRDLLTARSAPGAARDAHGAHQQGRRRRPRARSRRLPPPRRGPRGRQPQRSRSRLRAGGLPLPPGRLARGIRPVGQRRARSAHPRGPDTGRPRGRATRDRVARRRVRRHAARPVRRRSRDRDGRRPRDARRDDPEPDRRRLHAAHHRARRPAARARGRGRRRDGPARGRERALGRRRARRRSAARAWRCP